MDLGGGIDVCEKTTEDRRGFSRVTFRPRSTDPGPFLPSAFCRSALLKGLWNLGAAVSFDTRPSHSDRNNYVIPPPSRNPRQRRRLATRWSDYSRNLFPRLQIVDPTSTKTPLRQRQFQWPITWPRIMEGRLSGSGQLSRSPHPGSVHLPPTPHRDPGHDSHLL